MIRKHLFAMGLVAALVCSGVFIAKFLFQAKKPAVGQGKTFDDMLLIKANSKRTFLGYQYPGIKWIKHVLVDPKETDDGEAGSAGQTDIGEVDLDGDKNPETIKAIWGHGVSDHSLVIEVYKGKKKINTLKPIEGIQPNYVVQDVDRDGKMEIVIWGGLWDFRVPGEDDVTDKTYEGHSDVHRYIVATYKWIRGQYYLWDVYTTKKKYEPFCESQPARG